MCLTPERARELLNNRFPDNFNSDNRPDAFPGSWPEGTFVARIPDQAGSGEFTFQPFQDSPCVFGRITSRRLDGGARNFQNERELVDLLAQL
jgi:hypothetical protein